MANRVLQRVGMRLPIIQAPMAGGGDTPQLVATVSNAGGLGSFGGAYSSPDEILETGRAIRNLTQQPFGINLFAPQTTINPSAEHVARATERLAVFYDELGMNPPILEAAAKYAFEDQLDAALTVGATVFSFTFGQLSSATIAHIKKRSLIVVGTATTVREAIALQESGVDAVVAQSSEAGGHRGSFLGDFGRSMIGGIALIPQMVKRLDVPVIASGGIMDGSGIVAALALGAEAVQLGTAFLTCVESGVSDAYKKAILHASEEDIITTRAFSGRPARGIQNRFTAEMESEDGISNTILPFPLQNSLTRPLRMAASKAGKSDLLSLWAGQAVPLARPMDAGALMALLAEEMELITRALQSYTG